MSEKEHCIEDVVDMRMLGSMTTQGWVVVERIEHDAPISFQDNYVPAPAHQGDRPYPQPITRSEIGHTVSFRIRRAAGSPIDAMNQALEGANKQLVDMSEQLKRDAKALAAEKADHEKTKERLQARIREEERAQRESEVLTLANRRLEADLGKVREHIGKKLFNEILPPSTKKD